MDQHAKQVWCEALESGEFTQGRNFLKKQRGGEIAKYCCLGVLKAVCPGLKGDNNQALKMTSLNLLNISFDNQTELISMNDTQRFTFKQIAAWIRKNL